MKAGGGGPQRPTLLAGGAVVALAAIVFAGPVFAGRVLFERDIHLIFWGQCAAFARAIRGGAWPFWNPWVGFGQPMWANPGAQVLYPFTWLNLLVRPEDYYTLYAVGHLVIAGLGMLALGRALRFSWTGAFAGAAVYVLSGPLLSSVNLWQHFAGAAWMPWVVAAAARALDRPSAGRVAAWSLAQSVQALSGSADLVVLTALPQAGVVAYRLAAGGSAGRRGRLAAVVAAAALAVGLTAAQWVPALEVLRTTVRAEQPESVREMWSIPPVLLGQAFIPVLPQDLPLRKDVRRTLYEGREPLLASGYLGLPALVLALAAFRSQRRRIALGASALLLLSFWFALGRHGFAYFWALSTVPSLAVFRYPVKALLLGALAFALLCAEGLDTWRAGKLAGAAGARLAVVATAIAAGALGAVAWLHQNGLQYLSPSPLAAASPGPVVALAALSAGLGLAAAGLAALSVRGNGARWGAAVAVVATLDLFAVHHDLNKVVPGATVRRTPEVVEVLRADGASRVHTFDYLRRPAGTPPLISEERPELARLPTSRRLIALAQQYVVIAPLWGFRGSFETDVVGLDSRQRRGLQLLAVAVQRNPWQFLRLLQTCGVTHVVARHSEGLELLEPLRVVHTPSAGEVHVFRVPGTLPRALVVPEARTADGLRAYQVLFEPTFDPRSTILLPSTERAGPAGPSAPWRIDIREERADRLGLTVTTARPGFLVVVDGYDKGWEAALDGQPVPVLRANVAFRGVAVPAGTHDVRLRYRPPRLGLGLTVSALSLAALLGLLWFGRGRAGDVP